MHRRLAVRGVLQGVGFRPWVWQQASALGLVCWVRNTPSGVEIDLHGAGPLLDELQSRLWRAPSPVRIQHVDVLGMAAAEPPPELTSVAAPRPADAASRPLTATVGTDLGVCPRCLRELFDPANRRWRDPFIACPACGPRYTLTRNLPFERPHTSMARFMPCSACAAEYADSSDRRAGHPTVSCPACGPRLWLTQGDGSEDGLMPIAGALSLLRDGCVLAVKGPGGFQLLCDARQPRAVARLRQRRHGEAKPLAVMVANTASVPAWATMTPHEQRWLQSIERPIVLLPQTEHAVQEMPEIAPGLAWLGVMLPCSPIHHLLFHEALGRPAGTDWLSRPQEMVLAFTSGNAHGSPLIIDNGTAMLELADVADAWLLHDLDIVARNDDSVLRVRADGSACFIRRARGYAPSPMPFPATPGEADPQAALAPSVLALGGLFKGTLCVTQGDRALVSPHIGDLDAVDTRVAFTRLADSWPGWLLTQPQVLACDLHPDFFSTTLAAHMAQTQGAATSAGQPLPLLQVQHHHAHIAAVLAEHTEDPRVHQPVVGLALDGHGLGSDGMVWGGELLRVSDEGYLRLGHLWPLPMPGNGAAAHEPWRMGASVLHALGRNSEISQRFERREQAAMLQQWLAQAQPEQLVRTSSLGRLFDAAAALLAVLGPASATRYEAEAAMRLESLAARHWPALPLRDGWHITEAGVLDWRPLMQWLVVQRNAEQAAAVFHATMAAALADWAIHACRASQVRTVAVTGGCLANRLLDEALHARLTAAGLTVWRPTQYPCGDGALSLGQAWVARQLWRRHGGAAGPRPLA